MKLTIRPEVYAEIDHYVQNSTGEVSGLGRIIRGSDNELIVNKIYLLKQENTSASTDLDKDAVAKLMFDSKDDEGDLNFWWHSHVNMAVYWSGTDMDTIKDLGANGYIVATVFNKKREMRSAYYQGKNHEFYPEVFADEIPTTILYQSNAAQIEEWSKELEEKSKPKVFTGNSGISRGKGYYNSFGAWVYSDNVKAHDLMDDFTDLISMNGLLKEDIDIAFKEILASLDEEKVDPDNPIYSIARFGMGCTINEKFDWKDWCVSYLNTEYMQLTERDLFEFYFEFDRDYEKMVDFIGSYTKPADPMDNKPDNLLEYGGDHV